MPKFRYRARDKAGSETTGTREAGDRFELARALRREGYTLISADSKEKKKLDISSFLVRIPFINRVTITDKIIFSKNLAVMITAGLPLTRALEVLSRETHNKKFKDIINNIILQIRDGHALAESFARHPKVFPQLYSTMIEAGEKTGKLQESLLVLANQMQADYDIIRKVRGAIMYPAIVLTAMFGVGIFMMIYVVPTLTQVFTELNVDLPPTTKFIINVSNLLTNYGLYALIGFIAFIILFIQGLKTRPVKNAIDVLLIRLPLFGPLTKKFNAARTARTLSSLISAGVPILESINITGRVVQNHLYTVVLEEARVNVQKGETISATILRHENLYPSLVGEMIAVGEETGESVHMLIEVATFYEAQVADATRDISTIIEPVLMIVIGIAVGFFAVSMIQPMYSISSQIS